MNVFSSIPCVMPEILQSAQLAGACDTHAHVFGPFEQYPLAFPPDYPVPVAPVETYLHMLDKIGCERGVLVQPSQQGEDLRILFNALTVGGERLRGVGAVSSSVSDSDFEAMNDVGVVGLRFVEARAPDGQLRPGSIGFDHIAELSSRMEAFGMSINVWAKLPDLIESVDKLLAPELPVVFEHMGMLDVSKGIQDPNFQRMLGLVREGRIWVKLSVCRCSINPSYEDLKPFTEALIEANEDRLLWGSDWPYIRMVDREPDAGLLKQLLSDWICDSVLERKIMVDNPAGLYRFEEKY